MKTMYAIGIAVVAAGFGLGWFASSHRGEIIDVSATTKARVNGMARSAWGRVKNASDKYVRTEQPAQPVS